MGGKAKHPTQLLTKKFALKQPCSMKEAGLVCRGRKQLSLLRSLATRARVPKSLVVRRSRENQNDVFCQPLKESGHSFSFFVYFSREVQLWVFSCGCALHNGPTQTFRFPISPQRLRVAPHPLTRSLLLCFPPDDGFFPWVFVVLCSHSVILFHSPPKKVLWTSSTFSYFMLYMRFGCLQTQNKNRGMAQKSH